MQTERPIASKAPLPSVHLRAIGPRAGQHEDWRRTPVVDVAVTGQRPGHERRRDGQPRLLGRDGGGEAGKAAATTTATSPTRRDIGDDQTSPVHAAQSTELPMWAFAHWGVGRRGGTAVGCAASSERVAPGLRRMKIRPEASALERPTDRGRERVRRASSRHRACGRPGARPRRRAVDRRPPDVVRGADEQTRARCGHGPHAEVVGAAEAVACRSPPVRAVAGPVEVEAELRAQLVGDARHPAATRSSRSCRAAARRGRPAYARSGG